MKVGLILKREFLSKIRNKSFIIMTFVSPLLMAGLFLLVAYLSTQTANTKVKIAIIDENHQLAPTIESSDVLVFEDMTPMGFDLAKQKLIPDGYAGILLVQSQDSVLAQSKFQFYSEENPSLDFTFKVERAIEKVVTQQNLINAHLDVDLINRSQAKVEMELYGLSGTNGMKGLNEIKMFIGGAFGYLIMMFIIIYGNMVMRSVIEEKTSRIIEVIISSVKPIQLMLGKILGTSLAGLLQFLIWVVLGFSLLSIAALIVGSPVTTNATGIPNTPQGLDMAQIIYELFRLPIGMLISSFVLYFIGGYLLYSSFYAAIGAAVDSETDSQQFLLPIISPLLIGVYVGFFTVINDPHGTIAVLFSMLPFTSPIVMLMRIPFGVPWWQLAISLFILFGTFMAVVWVASKIYRVGILMHGKKITYKELFKWLKY